ncbi:hypothetical protein TeGR_g1908 [Tetraparma gracilis]|uniref:Uncharacterized protein n=1 Tax=Tetraparma gracilis TaxID=2962635 RepID=A0ABQ6N7E3_9STRA|nr:hypothetical protein TeGR_g1908 [Tetraparma gracilis]
MSYSCNNNQNVFMTDPTRTTSRVLAPPGGGSQISLGWADAGSTQPSGSYESVAAQRRRRNNEEVTGKIGSPAPKAQPLRDNNRQPQESEQRYALPPQQQQRQQDPNHRHGHLGMNVSSNAFSNGANQNCGNMITDRSSTRIHAPPGGRSNISCLSGWDEAPARAAPRQQAPAPQQQQQHRHQAPPAQTLGAYAAPPAAQQRAADPNHQHNHLGLGVSSNKFANGGSQNCGNMITDRSTTRIHAPPGGHSSIHFG